MKRTLSLLLAVLLLFSLSSVASASDPDTEQGSKSVWKSLDEIKDLVSNGFSANTPPDGWTYYVDLVQNTLLIFCSVDGLKSALDECISSGDSGEWDGFKDTAVELYSTVSDTTGLFDHPDMHIRWRMYDPSSPYNSLFIIADGETVYDAFSAGETAVSADELCNMLFVSLYKSNTVDTSVQYLAFSDADTVYIRYIRDELNNLSSSNAPGLWDTLKNSMIEMSASIQSVVDDLGYAGIHLQFDFFGENVAAPVLTVLDGEIIYDAANDEPVDEVPAAAAADPPVAEQNGN